MAVCCLGEQQAIIKSGQFHGGASHSRLQWKIRFLSIELPFLSPVLVDLKAGFCDADGNQPYLPHSLHRPLYPVFFPLDSPVWRWTAEAYRLKNGELLAFVKTVNCLYMLVLPVYSICVGWRCQQGWGGTDFIEASHPLM